jgi:hypothetical protein
MLGFNKIAPRIAWKMVLNPDVHDAKRLMSETQKFAHLFSTP